MTTKRETATEHVYQGSHLYFGNIKLVPYFQDYYPFDRIEYRDMWHVPGRRVMSTDALVTRATKLGITVTLTEYQGVATQTTRLN